MQAVADSVVSCQTSSQYSLNQGDQPVTTSTHQEPLGAHHLSDQPDTSEPLNYFFPHDPTEHLSTTVPYQQEPSAECSINQPTASCPTFQQQPVPTFLSSFDKTNPPNQFSQPLVCPSLEPHQQFTPVHPVYMATTLNNQGMFKVTNLYFTNIHTV